MPAGRASLLLISTHWSLGNMFNPQVWDGVLAHDIVELASLIFIGQAGRLETQASTGAAVLRQNFFSRKPQFLLKKLSY